MGLELIKKIREITGAGMVDIKKAIDEAGGDEEKAIEILRKSGQGKALKKADRETREGIVASYVHSNQKMASMVKLYCETDFVARNEEFQELANDIAMHVGAMSPKFLSPEEVSEELVAKEREIWTEQMKEENKPQDIMDKIMEGKEKKFREESALLTQSFVKNPDITIQDLVNEKIGKIGEKIQIGEFARFEI
ncbi:translation elongation factor Ts [Patescibacteria group bacterium]